MLKMKHKIPKQENLIYNNTLTTADVLLFLLMVTASLRKSITSDSEKRKFPVIILINSNEQYNV